MVGAVCESTGYSARMANTNGYRRAAELLNGLRNLDSPERNIAVAQADAILAIADTIADLTAQIARLTETVENLQGSIDSGAESLRQQIRTVAGL